MCERVEKVEKVEKEKRQKQYYVCMREYVWKKYLLLLHEEKKGRWV